ncbi:GTP-binding protein HflX [Aggregatibacter actinomycetemcomitans]|uniref:GTP-binding protein HflX n=1 Tax=Aggregatibacter actinomycetemcomitans TaxID=714 RepID=UPI0016527588|nr:GTP-binding protein HflX [Aggregatibacter actinomycetemcomitans]
MNPLLNNLSQSAVDSVEISTALFASDKPDNPSSHENHGLNHAIIVHCFFDSQKNTDDLNEFQLLTKSAQDNILLVSAKWTIKKRSTNSVSFRRIFVLKKWSV